MSVEEQIREAEDERDRIWKDILGLGNASPEMESMASNYLKREGLKKQYEALKTKILSLHGLT